MDFNITVLGGTLAAEPEHRSFPSGASLVRLLVTVRSSEPRRRVDVIPVTLWDPSEPFFDGTARKGHRVFVAGSIQRRFWSVDGGNASRIELVAHHVELRPAEGSEDDEGRASA